MVMLVSRLADRFGPKRTLTFVVFGLGLACFGMSWSYHMVGFFFAFAALRAFGQGSMPIHSTLLITQWFVRYRGRAIAVAGLGFSAATASVPSISRALIDSIGWREAYMVLGGMVWVLVVPAALFLIRNTPEEVGLHPDGASHPPEGEAASPPDRSVPDRRKVLTSRTFWLLALPLATPAFVMTALIFHQSSIFGERGLSPTVAAAAFVPYAIASALTAIASGLLIDRIGPKPLIFGTMTGMIGALTLVHYISTPAHAVGYAALLGASGGSMQVVSGVTWAHYYGRHRLGRVQGSAMMVLITAAAVGPLPLAALQSAFGGYGIPTWVMASLPVLSVAGLLLGRPQAAASPGP